MESADTLSNSLSSWLENREECAEELKELAQKLEDVHKGSNIAQVLGAATISAAAFISDFKGLAKPILFNAASIVSSNTFNKATKLTKEDEKVGKSIQKQLRDLKDRCGGALLGAHADELDLICQALGLNRSPEITSSLKVSAKEMMENIKLIGTKAADAGSQALGVIGLGISLVHLIMMSVELVKDNRVTDASKFLRDSARQILDGQQKLKEQLDAMHEMLITLQRKSLIENMGGYSLSIDEDRQTIIDHIKRNNIDARVLSWLQTETHQTDFLNLLQFCLERLGHITADRLNTPDGDHIDIVIVAHGGIVDEFMPSAVLVPAPYITDTVLYSPWNCAIDANVAFAIAQGNIHEKDRAFFNIAQCEPIPLPDHWNSMQKSPGDIPMILLSPLIHEEDAWKQFDQLWKNKRFETEGRVIIPYAVPQMMVKAYGEIPLYMFIFAISNILMIRNKEATVHLAACLSLKQRRVEWGRQYAYTSDAMRMTVNIRHYKDMDIDPVLYRAFSSMFDTNRR